MENFCGELPANKKLLILLIGIFLQIELCLSSQDFEGSGKHRVECKVVPLKARTDIKADTIFSGTVLSFYIKQPHRFLKHGKSSYTCNVWVEQTGPLACLSPFSVSCWIRYLTLIWYCKLPF